MECSLPLPPLGNCWIISSLQPLTCNASMQVNGCACFSALRVVEIRSGQIFVGNVDTKTVGLTALRSGLAVIPQDPVLFSSVPSFCLFACMHACMPGKGRRERKATQGGTWPEHLAVPVN